MNIRDIARLAKVTPGTVSKVIHPLFGQQTLIIGLILGDILNLQPLIQHYIRKELLRQLANPWVISPGTITGRRPRS